MRKYADLMIVVRLIQIKDICLYEYALRVKDISFTRKGIDALRVKDISFTRKGCILYGKGYPRKGIDALRVKDVSFTVKDISFTRKGYMLYA